MLSQPDSHHHKSRRANRVSIRLTESAVFLRTDGIPTRRGGIPDTRNSMVRGLLVLDLVKPTKLTSIEVELSATTSTAWPEGIGARRIDVTEEHRVFRATTTYLDARKSQSTIRRAASVGPGILYANQNLMDYENGSGEFQNDFDEGDWDEMRGQMPRMQETVTHAGRSRSRGVSRGNSESIPHATTGDRPSRATHRPHQPDPSIPSTSSGPRPDTLNRPNRRVSIDNGQFQRWMPSYETQHDDGEASISSQGAQQLAPIPPYSPLPPSSLGHSDSTRSDHSFEASQTQLEPHGPAQSLEEFRNSFLQTHSPSQSQASLSPSLGSALSLPLSQHHERSLSRHTSVADPIPENREPDDAAPVLRRPVDSHPHRTNSPLRRPPPLTRSPVHSATTPRPMDMHPTISSSSSTISPSIPSSHTERDRKSSRFSLSELSSLFMDAVRPHPSRSKVRSSRERTPGTREPSVDGSITHRGRTMERGVGSVNPHGSIDVQEEGSRKRESKERGRKLFEKLLDKDKDKDGKQKAEGWVEFKQGVYTYPISFTIPCNAPPTMQCDFGSVSWQLKASVHRPGTFKPKMTAVREVVTISCPTEEDTEDTENIIVERQWESQLQYLLSISGRSFYIGGTVPVTFTFMPLAKMRIHRLSVYIEERVDYYTNMRRIARTDPLTRFTLMSIKGEGRGADPILPLESDSPNALRMSPLNALVDPSATDDELSEIASNLMGPGPWTFHQELKLPKSCDAMHFTNKNRRSNIVVSHLLKVVIRVERGDDLQLDAKTGKRKLFDIVVQTPVLILSCRCNPEWTSLPRYAAVFDDSQAITPSCPCQVERAKAQAELFSLGGSMSAALERMTSRQSSDSSSASTAETSPVSPATTLRHMNRHDSLLRTNNLYERLMSGQETETGEAPPAYDGPSSSTSPHTLASWPEVVVN